MSEENVVDSGIENNEAPQPSESEVKARRLGWVPQEEFKGDPEQWRDADAFLKRGEEIQGYLKADLQKLHETLSQRDKDIAEMRHTMDEFRKFHQETEKRAYTRALDELKQLKVEAIERGEGQKVVEIDEQIDLIKEAAKKPQTSAPPPPASNDFVEWLPENQWYVKNKELQELADDVGELVQKNLPHLKGKAFLDEVTNRVKKLAPDAFENPARSSSQVSTNSSNRVAGGKSKKGYSDLPAEAKAACDRFVKQKLMTVDQYLAEYDWS